MDCGHWEIYRRVRRGGDFVYFCRGCDDDHEAQSWWFWRDLALHYGVLVYRTEERVKKELRGRLRWMLFKESGKYAMRFLALDEAARRAAKCSHLIVCKCARAVLERLSRFETKHGRYHRDLKT